MESKFKNFYTVHCTHFYIVKSEAVISFRKHISRILYRSFYILEQNAHGDSFTVNFDVES